MRSYRVYRLIAVAALALVVASFDDGGGASAAGLGRFCGGRLGIACDRGLFCDFPAGTCGSDNAEGTCVTIRRFCARRLTFRPVCGCNGRTYPNDCQRRQAIVAKRHDGRC
ncbi:MAG: Kazal domain-containing protein [Xanthobacteraceae bacterium]|nr:Kazal domain-containing protein [Xanthobacteraceae bacterium]